MRKLSNWLMVLALLALPLAASAQWSVDDTVSPDGTDPNKVQGIQGVTGGTPVDTTGSVTVAGPVTAVTTGGDEIANEATLEALRLIADAIKTAIEGTGAAAQEVQGTAAFGATPVGDPLYIAEDTLGKVGLLFITTSNELITRDTATDDINGSARMTNVSQLDGTEWSVPVTVNAVQTDTLIKACPLGKRLVITGVIYSSGGSVKYFLQDEDDTMVMNTIHQVGAGSGAVAPAPKDAPWAILGTDKDLEFDSDAAIEHGLTVKGYIID